MIYSLFKVEKINIRKTKLEVLQVLLDKLQLCQWTLGLGYIGKNQLISATQRVCYRVSELEFVLFTFTIIFEELFFKLWLSILTYDNCNTTNIQYFTDRRFRRHDYEDQYNKSNNTYNRYDNNHNGRKL